MNVYQKLVEVRKTVTYIQKEKEGAQYRYVSSSQVLAAVRDKMDEVQLVLIPRITGHKVSESTIEYKDRTTNDVNKRTITYFTELDMTMTWVNAEKPDETIECAWYAQGVDIAGEKGVGKALTYGEKTFILKQFNIATDTDDPDMFQQPPRPEPYSPPIGGGKKDEPKPVSDLEAIEQASKEHVETFSDISEGQQKMLHAKAAAAGFKPEDREKMMARMSAFLGYAIRDFSSVKKNDVTRLAQHLDKSKKTA